MADENRTTHDTNDTNYDREVSLRPSDYEKVERPPDICDVRSFTPNGEHDNCVSTDVTRSSRRALATIADEARRPPSHVAIWAMKRGIPRIYSLPDVCTVIDAKRQLLRFGSDLVAEVEEWSYRVARESPKRMTLRRVGKAEIGALAALSANLGLPLSTTSALTIITGLVDAPALPGDLPLQLLNELQAFRRAVALRAMTATALVSRAAKNPATLRQLNWHEIVNDD